MALSARERGELSVRERDEILSERLRRAGLTSIRLRERDGPSLRVRDGLSLRVRDELSLRVRDELSLRVRDELSMQERVDPSERKLEELALSDLLRVEVRLRGLSSEELERVERRGALSGAFSSDAYALSS